MTADSSLYGGILDWFFVKSVLEAISAHTVWPTFVIIKRLPKTAAKTKSSCEECFILVKDFRKGENARARLLVNWSGRSPCAPQFIVSLRQIVNVSSNFT